jgi:hypothetical protein
MKDVRREKTREGNVKEGNVKEGNGCWTNAIIEGRTSTPYTQPRLRPAFIASGFEYLQPPLLFRDQLVPSSDLPGPPSC